MKFKYLLFFFGFMTFLGSFAQDDQNQLRNINTIKDTLHFDRVSALIKKRMDQGKLDSLDTYIDQLYKKAYDLSYNQGKAMVSVHKGDFARGNKDYEEAFKAYDDAEKYYKTYDDLRGISIIFNRRYILEHNRGNLEKAADYLLEGKMYLEKLGNSIGLSTAYNNLGNVHLSLDNLDKSIGFYKKAIAIRKEFPEDRAVGLIMNNLIVIYLKQRKLDSARTFLPEALAVNKEKDVPEYIAHSYSIYGELALHEHNFEIAKKYYDTAMSIPVNKAWEILKTESKQQIAYADIQLKEYDKAEELLENVRGQLDYELHPDLLLRNYEFTAKLDSARGRYSSALLWQKKYQEISDKRMAKLSSKKMERAEARYLAELKNMRLIEEQKTRERKSQTEIYKYRLFTFITIATLLLFSVFMFFLVKARKERKRLIVDLNSSNQVKNKLFSIISHDLKNEISGLDNSLKLLNDNTISQEEFYELVPILTDRTQQTSSMLHNLLNWSKSQMNELKAKPKVFDLKEVIDTKFKFFKPKADLKNIKLINTLEETKVFADQDMVGIVAQNLIANAIKFCNSGDSISLVAEDKGDVYKIHFVDTGVGIKEEYLSKLFAEETFTTRGTKNEAGTGLGLRICKELVELNKGKIAVTSTFGKGSTFSIDLPKTNS